MSPGQKDRFGLALMLVIIACAFFFVTPFFRFSCSRVFIAPLLGQMDGASNHGMFVAQRLSTFVPLLVMSALWVVVALWVYHDAEKRGHSGLLWGLFVFVGSIIGLIIYFIVRGSSGEWAYAPAPPPTHPCPSCNQPVQSTYVACPYCGTALAQKCAHCGKPTELGWKVCPYCGEPLGG
jgi:hypothetical protein